eukprot:6609655-Pyramimonas_sp.AAC.1
MFLECCSNVARMFLKRSSNVPRIRFGENVLPPGVSTGCDGDCATTGWGPTYFSSQSYQSSASASPAMDGAGMDDGDGMDDTVGDGMALSSGGSHGRNVSVWLEVQAEFAAPASELAGELAFTYSVDTPEEASTI